MNAKKKGLGRGLSALLDSSEAVSYRNSQRTETEERKTRVSSSESQESNFTVINIKHIEENPFQPRTDFEKEPLNELAQSIKSLGIIQPITVRSIGANRYQLISGERRFRASQIAGLEKIPAYIRNANDDVMLQLALVENIQRENLNSIEVAISYDRLIEECSINQEELSNIVGKNRTTIANYLRLLKLPPEIQLGLRLSKISMGHARSLVNVTDPEKQLEIFNKIIEDDLSVRKAEELVRDLNKPKTKKIKTSLTQNQETLKNNLTNILHTKVDIKRNANGKGNLVISFKSEEHLKEMIKTLNWE